MRLPDRMLLLIAGACAKLGVDGHRADIVTARAAKALAALDGADEVDAEHVRRAARLALAHRRRRGPLQQPGLDDSELDDALQPPDDDPEPPAGGDGRAPSARTVAARREAAGREPRGEAARQARRAPTTDAATAATRARPRRAHRRAPVPRRRARPRAPRRARRRRHARRCSRLAGQGQGAAGRRSRTTTGEPVDCAPADRRRSPTSRSPRRSRAVASAAAPPRHASTCASTCAPARRATSSSSASTRPGRWARGGGWRRSRASCSACSPTPTSAATGSRS